MRTSTSTKLLAAAGVAGLAAAGLALPATADAAAARTVRAAGPLVAYTAVADNPLEGVHAAVEAITTGNETTVVTLHLRGIDPSQADRTFGAHVHTGPCADGTSAGPHYTHPTAPGSLEDREIWLDVTVNRGGTARARADRPWVIGEEAANSVVIHARPTNPNDGTAGTRLACIGVDF